MRFDRFFHLPAAMFVAFMLLVVFTPRELRAVELTVNPKDPTCGTSSNPTCYTSIQAAITGAVNLIAANPGTSYSIMVEPGTYSESVTLQPNIPVSGRETARTIIASSGTGAAITVNGINTPLRISHFTFINSPTGILVSNSSSSVTISNNVFQVGLGNTAIQVSDSSTPQITNNAFYQNGTAILSAASNLGIVNNIFFNNALAISTNVTPTVLLNNLFDLNNNIGPVLIFNATNHNGDPVDANGNIGNNVDPKFVNPAAQDFHLQENSPCIGTGNTSVTGTPDIGAYGGPNADTIPFPVTITAPPNGTTVPSPPYSVSLTWTQNLSYIVTNSTTSGGYKIYYNLNTSGAPYNGLGITEGPSPIDVGNTLSETLTGLSAATAPSSAPTLNPPGFANQTLKLSWSSVTGATGYKVYYTDTDVLPLTEQSQDVGPTTSHDLTGLINDHHYQVTVSAYTQNTYYFAVTDHDNTGSPQTPGVAHESAYSSEVHVTIGSPAEGPQSSSVTEFPEPVTPNPNLLNKGCFIATAAYGYYSAPQVQALREFRDRYLLTNMPGRAFVQWYYRNGPIAAQFINEHPVFKPVVRAALMPAVAGAMFMTRTSMFIKICVFVFIWLLVALSVWVYRRRESYRAR